MLRIALGVFAVLTLAGCAANTPMGTTSQAPVAFTSTSAAPPPGWVRDPCDARDAAFSGNAHPRDLFRRNGNESARLFAEHVVEAVGDQLMTPAVPGGDAERQDPHAWQTRQGFIEVYGRLDPAAWSADYTATTGRDADSAMAQNGTAHAILGSLQVNVEGLAWTGTSTALDGARHLGGSSLPLIHVESHGMEAEQAQLERRDVHVDPDYDMPFAVPMGLDAAQAAAQAFLDCKGQAATTAMHLNGTAARFVVVQSNPAYWFPVEPVAGWDAAACGPAAEGRLHIAVDAGTGTVLSADLACGAMA